MIEAICKGKYSTFTIPIEENAFAGYEGYRWDNNTLWVRYKGPYDVQAHEHRYFGCTRIPFPDCCGADMLYSFTSIVYGSQYMGLKDPNHAPDKKWDDLFRKSWEPWYNEIVTPFHKPAIGIVPATMTSDNKEVERSEFYKFLKNKGKFMGRWMNQIYQDSILDAYLFVHPESKTLDISYGSHFNKVQKAA